MTKMIYKTAPVTAQALHLKDKQYFDDPCAVCGGQIIDGLSDLELKSVRQRRQARFMALELKMRAAKLQGMTHKIWQTMSGSRVRNSHIRANRQRVPIDAKFRIGSEHLMLPADPTASFAETANCRCDVDYITIEQSGPDAASPSSPSRPDLPLLNGIQSNVKFFDLLNHFFNGNGARIRVAFSEVEPPEDLLSLRNRGGARQRIFEAIEPYRNQDGEWPVDIDFGYNPDFSSFGDISCNVTGTLSSTHSSWKIEGQLTAGTDTWDFTERPFTGPNSRSLPAEMAVRIFNAGRNGQGTPFVSEFVGGRSVDITAIWNNIRTA